MSVPKHIRITSITRDTNKMIYRGPVEQGQNVRVNAGTDQIVIGGKTVSERPISDEHKYKIYYRKD